MTASLLPQAGQARSLAKARSSRKESFGNSNSFQRSELKSYMSSKNNALVVFIRLDRFFEAEITWPALQRMTHNDVVEHVDLQDPASFGQPASQPDISFAKRRISRYAASGITGIVPHPRENAKNYQNTLKLCT